MQVSIPGFETVATTLMKKTIKNVGVADISDLRTACIDAGVKMLACQMTMDLFGFTKDDFIDGLDFVGAASYLAIAENAKINLFI